MSLAENEVEEQNENCCWCKKLVTTKKSFSSLEANKQKVRYSECFVN
jgi:hypothetical protein